MGIDQVAVAHIDGKQAIGTILQLIFFRHVTISCYSDNYVIKE
jgi:hypothetical protein